MSFFNTKKKQDTLKLLAEQSLTSYSTHKKSRLLHKVRSFFSSHKLKNNIPLKVHTGDEHAFYCREKPQLEDIITLERSSLIDSTTFTRIKNTRKKRRSKFSYTKPIQEHKGGHTYFINVEVTCSAETQAIIDECIHAEVAPISSRQSIQTLPQLCQHYLLTQEEIHTLCYIVYDCTYIKNSEYFHNKSPMAIARYLCKERRHILRFSIITYASLVQHITITQPNIIILDILTWINAIARMVQLVTSLTILPQDNSLLVALIALPRKALINLTQGRTVDKTLLNLIRENKELTLETLQSYIIIVAVTHIILDQFKNDVIHSPLPLLLHIDKQEYIHTTNPLISLMQIFRSIHDSFLFLFRSNIEYFTYALQLITAKNEAEDTTAKLKEINTILYTILRIEQLYNRKMTKDEAFAIINKLSESTVDIVRFYGIHPKEFFTGVGGFYFSLLQLLAYIQYNKMNNVTPQTAIIMRFIPLHLYKNSEKPYQDIQEECNTIITQCPYLLTANDTVLENILLEKILLFPMDKERDIHFFKEIEHIVIAFQKIQAIQIEKSNPQQNIQHTLCTLSSPLVYYLSQFPEIYFSPLLHHFPHTLMNRIYSKIRAHYNNASFHYHVCLSHLSPLSFQSKFPLQEEYTPEEEEKIIAYGIELVETMNALLTCREGYTEDVLSQAFNFLMPLYYKYPLHKEAPQRLTLHVNEVLEVITEGSPIPLQELCRKPKNLLKRTERNSI